MRQMAKFNMSDNPLVTMSDLEDLLLLYSCQFQRVNANVTQVMYNITGIMWVWTLKLKIVLRKV